MWRVKWNVKEIWIGEFDFRRVDLADITGIRPTTIGEIISGMNNSITLDDLGRLCYALQKNIDEVLVLVKDSEILEGEERDRVIREQVAQARTERAIKAAEKKKRDEEIRRAEEEKRIREAIQKYLLECGLITEPNADE